ncbi:copper amine oxidase N-terminal domain-containing protein [Paenibacillus sp. LHD-117]|uniref:copper amine oxidase N-terminal domain-containing protein n=1 Tax=Paenibacillus sp. LHD-117 TaxID=3071412 RepID=UPI0027E1CF5A|nr:copper amine oxidase N-terminal domain-containing protein [Paenibacillus sp. LHD-117]MDQ6419399.1 copper amine oxidase N-terminal domain-containing protein [Paenibacillus sp. LHD-117]
MKTTMKKAFVTLTAVSCLACGASLAAAQPLEIVPISAPITGEIIPISAPINGEVVPISAPNYVIAHQNKLAPVRVYGQAASIEENRITLENNNENAEFPSIVLNIGENTRILDAVDGLPIALEDIRENETLYAYVGPAMTMSLPPISNAELIIAGIPADFAVPSYAEVESVKKGADGSVVLKTNQDSEVTVTKETTLLPFLTKNIITVDMLRPGSKVLVWEQAPAADGEQASPAARKVVAFPYEYAGYVEADLDGIAVNGEALVLSEAEATYAKDGQLMLPLRKLAEALGYEIKWDAKTSGIEVLSGDSVLYSFTARGSEVTTADGETRDLLAASVVKGGVTFLAADDLIELNGVKIVK